MEAKVEKRCVRVLCQKLVTTKEAGLQWLIGSPFFPHFTIISSLRSVHSLQTPFSPHFAKEADDLRTLLLRGFDVIGALYVAANDCDWEQSAHKAVEATRRLKQFLCDEELNRASDTSIVGAAVNLVTGDLRFFVSASQNSQHLETLDSVFYDDSPDKFVWENGCLVRCEMKMRLPVFVPIDKQSEAESIFSSTIDATIAKLKDPHAVYMVESENAVSSQEINQPILIHSDKLDFETDLTAINVDDPKYSTINSFPCAYFCSKNKFFLAFTLKECADTIRVTFLLNQSRNDSKPSTPVVEYISATEPARVLIISLKLDVLCYASKALPVAFAISKLIIPGLANQLIAMKKIISPNLMKELPELCPYHFLPPGILHPITSIYELSYGEKELRQVEIRKSLHQRLGLPLDRPLLLTANALSFGMVAVAKGNNSVRGSVLLRDVHTEIPNSGVSGGLVSMVQGSYEYHHYLKDGFDDSGWGCAYRSLQTIISWFRLQHYTSIEVPSHREIQQSLVEIGDKEPGFIGSREWIGAIELSFVLDKLLGVSCKILNVRSGAELPEKCRELALHFETQGTPVMIGGGVLAYTLLGVDYNDESGHCAFLILDPHYTGNDDLKKIVNGGWCGWKKAVDSKGQSFFLHDKFYNLLLPQRPNMV